MKEMQRQLLLRTVAVAALAVLAIADTIQTVYPAKDDVVSDCPLFQWLSCPSCDESGYTVTIKSTTTGNTITKTSRLTTLYPTPEDDSSLLDIGSYTWQVTQGSIQSAEIPFQICTKSCLPPKVKNNINNTLAGFTFSATGGKTFVETRSEIKFRLTTEKGEEKNVTFLPVTGTKILSLTHDNNNDGVTEGTATAELHLSRGDNILTMRYVLYSAGEEPMKIEILDSSDSVVRTVGCITRSGNGCHASGTTNDRLVNGDWEQVIFSFDPLPEGETYKLRFTMVKNATIAGAVPAFVNDIVLGQCSTLEDRNAFTNMEYCIFCKDAGLYVPKTRKCAECNKIQSQSACCASIDYCTACLSSGACEATTTSTCKSEAQCETLNARETCLDTVTESKRKDCMWCPIDGKCFFHTDYKTNCSQCSSFKSSDTCPSSECQWCPISRRCVGNTETCPSCESIAPASCTLANTDNECQYCTAKRECLQKDAECTQECSGLNTSSKCSANVDCQWCSASEACFEKRIPCKQCASMNLNSSCGNLPGCYYCGTGYCGMMGEECPTCGTRAKDVCTFEGEQTLLCKFCPSNRTCMDNSTICDTCSKVTDQSVCNQYQGCSFCISKGECMDVDETCEQCARMSMGQCAKFPTGCCWSQKDNRCYNFGSTECEGGLSAAYIALIAVAAVVVVALIVVAIVVPICCCRKDKNDQGIALSQTGTSIVVLPEGEASFVAPESLQTVAIDPNAAAAGAAATPVSVGPADASAAQVTVMSQQQASQMSPTDMQSMMAQQQQQMNVMMSSMLAQQQQMSAMMMNPMMMNSMAMGGMNGMNGMGGMNSMNGMGGMGGMNSMGGMNGMSMDMSMMGTAGVPAPPEQPGQVPPPPPTSS